MHDVMLLDGAEDDEDDGGLYHELGDKSHDTTCKSAETKHTQPLSRGAVAAGAIFDAIALSNGARGANPEIH